MIGNKNSRQLNPTSGCEEKNVRKITIENKITYTTPKVMSIHKESLLRFLSHMLIAMSMSAKIVNPSQQLAYQGTGAT